jgi:acetolactate synthase-1/2/3 large subunit
VTNGAQLLVKALQAEGVRCVFGLAGVGIFPIFDACLDAQLRLVDVRHEAAGVHMAAGWARVTGEPGVCLVTEGPGHANAMPGLITAFADDTPVLLLSGMAETENWGRGAIQEIPQVEMAGPVSRWSAVVPEARRIPEMMATAFRHMRSGHPGPVHLSLPVDVLEAKLEEPAGRPGVLSTRQTGRAFPDPREVERTIDLLSRAERPIVIAGTDAWWAQAGESLRAFIETTKIPLFTLEHARGLVSDDHPLCFGNAYSSYSQAAQQIRQADLVLLLGEKVDFRFMFGYSFGREATFITVHPSPEEVGRNRAVAVGIAADIGATLEQLVAVARGRRWTEGQWLQALGGLREAHEAKVVELAGVESSPLHPLSLVREVEPFLDREAILVFDGADFAAWAQMALKARRPGGWLPLGFLGMLGTGVPYAVAAKAARPEAQVVCFTGDGALGFHLMEFDTAIRHRLPFVVVVGNDAAWGIEQHFQRALYSPDRLVGTSLRRSRYDLIVEALGGHGEFVEQSKELRPALERAFASGKPSCVNVAVQHTPSPMTQAFTRFLLRRRGG